MATPYLSQWQNISEEEWRSRACGIVCAAMVLQSHGIEATPDELLAESRSMKGALAWTSGGIPHATICALIRNRGLHSYQEEFRGRHFDPVLNLWRDDLKLDRKHLDYGLLKIRESISKNEPCLVSVSAGFRTNEESHLVVVIGASEDNGFIINDPDNRLGSGESIEIPLDKFEEYFRRLAIFATK